MDYRRIFIDLMIYIMIKYKYQIVIDDDFKYLDQEKINYCVSYINKKGYNNLLGVYFNKYKIIWLKDQSYYGILKMLFHEFFHLKVDEHIDYYYYKNGYKEYEEFLANSLKDRKSIDSLKDKITYLNDITEKYNNIYKDTLRELNQFIKLPEKMRRLFLNQLMQKTNTYFTIPV